jgi:NTE family protein
VDAILATIAMPGVFPARYVDGLELVDGGVLDPVPVAPARMLAPRLPVVAVVLTPPMGIPAKPMNIPFHRYWGGMLLSRIFSRMRYASVWDIFSRSLDITSRAMTQYRLEVDKPEVIIRPEVHHIDTLDLVDVREVVQLGEASVTAALPALRGLFTWRNRWRRRNAPAPVFNHRSL